MVDFDGDGEFDAIDEAIEYSIVAGKDITCPGCSAELTLSDTGASTCPTCGVAIQVE